MSKVIEVYVRNEVVSDVYREKGCEHTASGQVDMYRPVSKLQFRKTAMLPESDREALDTVLKVAMERGWKVRVVNVSTLLGRLRAGFRGVDETPTIMIGKHKKVGVPEEQELLSYL
jgi:hypothetical protein